MPNALLRVLVPTVVGAATMWASAARADVTKPAWCGSDTDKFESQSPRDAVKEKDPRWAIYRLVNNICNPDDEGKQMYKELLAAQKKWGATLDMNDDDWKDAVDFSLSEQSNRGNASFNMYFQDRSLSSLDPIEQYGFLDGNDYAAYYADALGPKLTEVGRLGLISSCVRNTEDAGVMAVCKPDVDKYDWKKMAAAARAATKRSGFERMLIRFWAYEMQDKVKAWQDAVKALSDKDETYAKLFAIAEPIHTAWESRYSSDLYTAALVMDDARLSGSRKAYADCEATTRKAWNDAIGKLPAKTFDGIVADPGVKLWAEGAIEIAMNERDVYLASVAMLTCKLNQKDPDLMAKMLSRAIDITPGFRGPRTESHRAMAEAKLVPDSKSEEIRFPSYRRPWFEINQSRGGGEWGDGEVAKMVDNKDGTTTISFAAKWEKQSECLSSKETNKFLGFDTAGRPYYQSICLKWTKVKVNTAHDPVKAKNSTLAQVKKGMMVEVNDEEVVSVFGKKGGAPVAVFGVEMK